MARHGVNHVFFFCYYVSGNAESDDYDYNSSYLYRRTQPLLLFQNFPCNFAAMKKLFHCSAYNLHSFGERDVTVSWILTKQDLAVPHDKILLSSNISPFTTVVTQHQAFTSREICLWCITVWRHSRTKKEFYCMYFTQCSHAATGKTCEWCLFTQESSFVFAWTKEHNCVSFTCFKVGSQKSKTTTNKLIQNVDLMYLMAGYWW